MVPDNIKKDHHILLVEDNAFDVKAVKRAFKQNCLSHNLHVAEDGLDALDILRGVKGDFPIKEQVPKLILLDLKMPRMGGLEFLAELRADKFLKSMTAVVLTTSDLESDIRTAYQYHVAGYIVKSLDFKKFVKEVSKIDDYWSMCVL